MLEAASSVVLNFSDRVLKQVLFGDHFEKGHAARCAAHTHGARVYAACGRASVTARTNASSCLVVQHSKTPSQCGSYTDITESP